MCSSRADDDPSQYDAPALYEWDADPGRFPWAVVMVRNARGEQSIVYTLAGKDKGWAEVMARDLQAMADESRFHPVLVRYWVEERYGDPPSTPVPHGTSVTD